MSARSSLLCARVSRAELAAVRRAAKAAGHSGVSTWVRQTLLAGLEVHGAELPDARQLPLLAPRPGVVAVRPRK